MKHSRTSFKAANAKRKEREANFAPSKRIIETAIGRDQGHEVRADVPSKRSMNYL